MTQFLAGVVTGIIMAPLAVLAVASITARKGKPLRKVTRRDCTPHHKALTDNVEEQVN